MLERTMLMPKRAMCYQRGNTDAKEGYKIPMVLLEGIDCLRGYV